MSSVQYIRIVAAGHAIGLYSVANGCGIRVRLPLPSHLVRVFNFDPWLSTELLAAEHSWKRCLYQVLV